MANVQELIVKLKAENKDLKEKLKEAKASTDSFGGAVSKLGPMIAGAFTVKAVVNFARESFAAFEEAEQADRRLLFALNGNQAAFESLTRQANELRNATGIDDEDIKQVQMLGVSSGKSAGEVKKITQAAIELSAKTGQDLQAAYMMLNGTLAGSAGRLGRVDAEFSNLTADQLKNGEAIDLVLKKWSGSAANAATESQKLKTTWGEIKETVGGGISTVINPLLSDLNESLKGVSNSALTASQRFEALFNADYAKFANDAAKKFEESLATTRQMSAHEEKMAGFEKQRKALLESISASSAKIVESKKQETKETEKSISALDKYIQKMNDLYKRQQEWNENAVPNMTGAMLTGNVKQTTSKGISTPEANTSYFDIQREGADKLSKSLQNLQAQFAFVTSEEREMALATNAGYVAMDAFNMMINDGQVSLESMGAAIYDSARQAIAAELAQGIAAVVRSALVSVPFPFNLAIAAGAGAAAGALFNKAVPKLAEGGIAYDQSSVIVGEYPGARTNPEVIAPLNKLQDLLGGGTQRIEIYGTLRDDHIALSNQRGQRKLNLRG